MKKLSIVLLLLVLAVILAVSISAADISVEANDGRVFSTNTKSFYLPSYISPESVNIVHDGSKTITYEDSTGATVDLVSGVAIDLTPFKTVEEGGKITYTLKAYINGTLNSFVFNFANSLPSVHVQTSMGIDEITSSNGKDKETKVVVINKDGTYEYADSTETKSEFKVRGNTTKDYAKKPFQIKFPTSTDLFGMGKSKTWILLANYLDQSNIRNSVMYKIAKLLGMDASDFQSVDLFVDGQYYGIYLLCEKVQIGENRVDIVDLEDKNDSLNDTYSETNVVVETGIPDTIISKYAYIPDVVNPEDITGGYIVELDNNYWSSELCYFITENGSHYVVKYPEYASKEQVEYIATIFGEMEEAIMAEDGYNRLGKHYSEYMDVDSFAVAYIIAEFSRNYDAGSSSMFFYKDVDVNGEFTKIVKGPLWDCDNTLGNILKNGAANPEGYWARGRSIWGGLTQHTEFNERVTKIFTTAYDQIFDMIDAGGYIYEQVEEIGQSIHMERDRWHSNDYSKWPFYYFGIHYDRWQSSQVFNFVNGYYSYDYDKDNTTVIGYLCEHIEARLNWLAAEWGCAVDLRERNFEESNVVLGEIFTFKGYSFSPDGRMAVGFDIDYSMIDEYEAATGKALQIGVVYAGFDLLCGQKPVDSSGNAILLDSGKVIKCDLTNYAYMYYDVIISDITDELKDTKLVVSAYLSNGEQTKFVQENGLCTTVTGTSYNEAKNEK